MTTPKSFIKSLPLLAGVIVFSLAATYFALAWTEPTNPMPDSSVSAPLTVSTTNQSKQGDLSIGTNAVKYWITQVGQSFALRNNAGATTFIIGQDGHVGIGTATPDNLLQVQDLIDFDNTDYNTKLGYQAGKNIVSGAQRNTFIGNQAGVSNAGTAAADNNIAIGYQTFYVNQSGTANTVVGTGSMANNMSGNYNTVFGYSSLFYNTSGHWNTAIGAFSLRNNYSGSQNVALGYYAGAYETGSDALYVNNRNRTNITGDRTKSLLYGTFADATSSQQLTVNGTLNVAGNTNISGSLTVAGSPVGGGSPTGAITSFAGSSAPSGWFICNGSAVSRATYATLFAVIGTTYGAGDGSTTFNLPNLLGKIPVGYDSTQTEFNALAKTGGEKAHTLTINEMPSHFHQLNGYTRQQESYGNNNNWYSGSYGSFSNVTQSAGGDTAHNNLQPYIVLNYIIKY